jgi:hypothetical protein
MVCALATACGSRDAQPRPSTAGVPPYVPTPAAAEPAPAPQTPRRLRRLTNVEIEEVVTDLLEGHRLDLGSGFLPDPRVEGYDNDALALGVSESKVEEIVMMAERVAARLAEGPSLAHQAPCAASEQEATCARAFATRAATRAWGRPPTPEELDRLDGVYQVGREGEGYAGGIALLTQAVLQSPHFIYRSELGPPPTQADLARGWVELTGVEIASVMSFLLRGTRPDAQLLETALTGALATPDAREQEARRLLASPEGRRRISHFLRAWLGLDNVAMINKDVAIFPFFTPRARRALDRELSLFLDHVLANGARLDELLLADYTFPGPELAPFYNADLLEAPGDHSMRRLNAGRRLGVLSLPAFLASHALIDQTNPIERGLVVRGRLFCQDVSPPPPNVAAQRPGGGPETTTRQRYEAHARDPFCRVCHQLMDPLGFGFEQFDAVGRYRTEESGQPIDSRGEVLMTDVDGPFTGPAELAPRLLASAQFRHCFVEQLFRFAEGRSVEGADRHELDFLASSFEQAEHRIDELFVRLVRRPVFVLRKIVAEVAP